MLRRLYGHRIVNVNAHIVIANLVAVLCTAVVVEFTPIAGFTALWIVVFSALLNIGFDVVVFSYLHFFVNKGKSVRFIVKDIVVIEIERLVISPLFWIVSASVQYVLLMSGVGAGMSVVVAYCCGLMVTRTVHTLWMLRQNI